MIVDADGHVLEPADTWLRYLEPSFRERAIRIAEDDRGYEASKEALRERLEAGRLDAEVETWVKELRSTAEIRYNPLGASSE